MPLSDAEGFLLALALGAKGIGGKVNTGWRKKSQRIMFYHLELKVAWVGACCSRLRFLSASDRYLTWVL